MSDITKEIVQSRPYSSFMGASNDADAYVKSETAFNEKQPRARQWNVTIAVNKAEVFRPKKPSERVRLDLHLTISGPEDRVEGWIRESEKMHGMRQQLTHDSKSSALAEAREAALEKKQELAADPEHQEAVKTWKDDRGVQ